MEIFYSSDIDSSVVLLDQEQSAHCVRVLRHRVGDAISVIDGKGSLYRCILEVADPREAVARVEEVISGFGAHPYRLTMAVCPTKNTDRFEWFVEKVTEVGVDKIVPVIADRSERRTLKTERLRRLALSAAKQSLKGVVPEVAEPSTVKDFIASLPSGALKVICHCDESAPRVGIRELLDNTPFPSSSDGACPVPEIAVLIGPEGDFSPEEVDAALRSGWKPVHLGDSRLRTETAALVAATAVYLKWS